MKTRDINRCKHKLYIEMHLTVASLGV